MALNFLIHYELADGSEDAILVTADTIDEVRALGEAEAKKRGGKNLWSEEVK